jgi:glycosyltransferase involved in cell wall biosynthesis
MNPGLTHITTVPETLACLRGQLDYMKARGLGMRAVTAPGPDLERFATEFDIEIDPVPMAREITPLADIAAVAAIRRVLRRHRPTIVHAHTPKGGLLGLAAASAAGVPVRIYHMRGLLFPTASGGKRALFRWTERLSCTLAHRVFAVSESLRALAVDARLCDPSKITVLGHGSGNGVDAAGRFDPDALGENVRRRTRSRLGIADDELLVGFVGRLVRDKGVVELMEAWQAIHACRRDVHLLVIGTFEQRDAIPTATARLLGTDPRVHVVENTFDMPAWYAGMDLVVLPTYREGFPNVLLEAAAMRLPVVATHVVGCVDAVQDGVTGILVPPRDAAALIRAIGTYLDRATLRRGHGAAARARVLAEFRPETIWQALYAEYARLLAQAGLIGDHLAPARAPR